MLIAIIFLTKLLFAHTINIFFGNKIALFRQISSAAGVTKIYFSSRIGKLTVFGNFRQSYELVTHCAFVIFNLIRTEDGL
jgi:hypothetical protein